MNNIVKFGKKFEFDEIKVLEDQIKETKFRLMVALKESPFEWHKATVVYALAELLNDFCVDQSDTENDYSYMLSFVHEAIDEVSCNKDKTKSAS